MKAETYFCELHDLDQALLAALAKVEAGSRARVFGGDVGWAVEHVARSPFGVLTAWSGAVPWSYRYAAKATKVVVAWGAFRGRKLVGLRVERAPAPVRSYGATPLLTDIKSTRKAIERLAEMGLQEALEVLRRADQAIRREVSAAGLVPPSADCLLSKLRFKGRGRGLAVVKVSGRLLWYVCTPLRCLVAHREEIAVALSGAGWPRQDAIRASRGKMAREEVEAVEVLVGLR